MIDFTCSSCGREFSVDVSKAGRKAKCRGCGMMIVVPNESEPELVFDACETECADPALQSIYESLLDELGERVLRHTVVDGVRVALQIRTETTEGRAQWVTLWLTEPNDNDDQFLIIISVIGYAQDEDHYQTLKAASAAPFVNISIDGDDNISARMLLLLRGIDLQTLAWQLTALAEVADLIEMQLFGWDET